MSAASRPILTESQVSAQINHAPKALMFFQWRALLSDKLFIDLWKKKAINLDEIATFHVQLSEVITTMTTLMKEMGPIYLGPKRKLVAEIKELQQKVAQQEQTPLKSH